MLRDFRFAIFDVDGTLLDTKKIYRKILRKILNSDPNSFSNRFYLNSFEERQERFIFWLKRKVDSLIYNFSEAIDSRNGRMFQGVKEVLEELADTDNRLRILASTGSRTERVKRNLKRAGILDFFELILGREIPKSRHIPLFAEHFGIEVDKFSRQAFYVGDELEDIILAKRFSLYGIGVASTLTSETLKRAGAKKIIGCFQELMKLI